MNIPPKKPHFFKPVQPGFKHGIKIPVGFLKYLKGEEHIEHAILKRNGKRWLIKLNDKRFEKGWGEFAEENDVQLGDMLVFRYEGNMEFEVCIFDSTHCDREYAEYLQEERGGGFCLLEEISKKFKFKERPRPRIKLSKKASSRVKAIVHHKSFGSHFDYTINSRCFLCLPQRFTYANGLINKKCDLIIRDERQRSWKLKLSSCKTRTYIIGGWHKFSADNCLKRGDRIMFEVVTNGETPVWKFRVVTNQETPLQNFQDIMKKPSSMSLLDAQVATSTSSDDDHPYFISTLKPYSFSKPNLYFPMDFAKSNGWINRKCEMILKDEAERCWSVWIGRMGHNFGITRGWTNFRVEKGLQVGDAYKFELIKNGKVPIAYFHYVFVPMDYPDFGEVVCIQVSQKTPPSSPPSRSQNDFGFEGDKWTLVSKEVMPILYTIQVLIQGTSVPWEPRLDLVHYQDGNFCTHFHFEITCSFYIKPRVLWIIPTPKFDTTS
ncbi:B3 domain-containing protein REM10 [Capsicum annuum]|uniref:B3 domain-containing protein REM10 n=1 Tax=Capsicum annuum TaxID=4072 RepID=UPI001FB131CC|nr:B3 domain-containing protein REM10 [Capsicum annuum]